MLLLRGLLAPGGITMDLVRFYRQEEPDDHGRWLHDYWSWDHDRLEAVHNYIQLMFPLTEASSFNPRAATLDKAALATFRADPLIQENLLRSLEVMLSFYGFTLDRTSKTIVPGPHFDKRAGEWLFPNDHNHLRITRILKCLTLCGHGEYALAFHAALVRVVRPENVTGETLFFWKNAVQ
jgi:hypothetical protein